MAAEFKTAGFVKGLQTKLPAEDIEQAAGSDALNWVSIDGKLQLIKGRRAIGDDREYGRWDVDLAYGSPNDAAEVRIYDASVGGSLVSSTPATIITLGGTMFGGYYTLDVDPEVYTTFDIYPYADIVVGSDGSNVGGVQPPGGMYLPGGIYADIWAPKVDGSRLHFVKRDTDIGYYADDEDFVPVITGLTAGSTYTFSIYSSLSGNYLYATGPDGLFKINLANPTSYKNMYVLDEQGIESANSDNYLGYSLINDRRMIMWNRFDDLENKTALFLSKIDPQDGTNYQFKSNEVLTTGNGSSTLRIGTLDAPALATARNFAFGIKIFSDTADVTEPVTGIVDGPSVSAVRVADTTGFAVGDWIHISGIVGTGTVEADLNNQIFQVTVVDTNFALNFRASTSGDWTSGGTVRRLNLGPYEDDNNGGFQNAPGSINYATGAVSITFPSAPGNTIPIYVQYQYEDSNEGGITDFSTDDATDYTQGTVILQEYLGEPIQNVLIFEGGYYSFKTTSVYELIPSSDWSTYTNEVYRADIGIPSLRAATSTGLGMVYMDTANPSKPILSILQRSTVGGNLAPVNLTPLFAWEDYLFDQCFVDTWGQNIIVSARTSDSETNNRLFLVNVAQAYSVDVTSYGANTASKDESSLYLGSPTHNAVWEAFTGEEDLGETITNYWEGKAETYGDDALKKTRYLQLRGLIDPDQAFEVYASYDNEDFELLGTTLGDQSYVDTNDPHVIDGVTVYPYLHQLKIRTPKFRTRKLRFVALANGYVDIEWEKDFDILRFEQRLPARSRVRVYESLDGTTSDLPNPP